MHTFENTNPFQGLLEFITVAETTNFTQAAIKRGVTTSALSQQIKKLEQRLNVKLLQRNTRSVKLTEEGLSLLTKILPIIQELTKIQNEITIQSPLIRGTLRLTSPIVGANLLMEKILAGFHQLHPDITIEVNLNDQLVDIIQEGYDAGIRLGRSVEQDMIAIPITKDCRVTIAGSPSYFKKYGTPKRPEELMHHQCILYRANPNQPIQPWELKKNKLAARYRVQGSFLCNHYSMALEAAKSGLGLVYVLPSWLIEDELKSGKLVSVLTKYCLSFGPIYLYYPSRNHFSPKMDIFVKYIKDRIPLKP